MKQRHLNLLFPQWQGGGQDTSTYHGGCALRDNYLIGVPLAEVEVSTTALSEERQGIIGYQDIYRQLARSRELIDQSQPETIFTIGGGCDADILPVAYLNRKLRGDLTVIWLDAHGDLNTPATSLSKLFYGMPIQVLLGNGDPEIVRLTGSKLRSSQLALLGNRNLDLAERDFINEQQIRVFDVDEIELDVAAVAAQIKAKGHQNIYIHIDLDVLDPAEFPYVPVPAPGGLKTDTLRRLLQTLQHQARIAGLGVFEYYPAGPQKIALLQEIFGLGLHL